jgi:cytochrome P450
MSESTLGVDLADPELFGDDPAALEVALARLRAERPVHWNRAGDAGFWVLTRHADVAKALAASRSLSSEYGNMLRVRSRPDPAAGKMLTLTDPPRHGELRAVFDRAVADRPVPQLVSGARRVVTELLDAALAASRVDFAGQVADRLPAEMTCEFMGVPDEDRGTVVALSLATFAADDPDIAGGRPAERVRTEAAVELIDYLGSLVRRRGRDPGDDLVSDLVGGGDTGGLSAEQIVMSCFNLLLGGLETTRSAAAGGLLALLDAPDQLALLRDRPHLVARAVEEIVRWTSPIRQVVRVCREPVVIGAVAIRPGETVSLWLASANRDESVFPSADRFRVDRWPNRHLGFGAADHRCIGTGLARLELKVLFSELAKRPIDITLDGPVTRVRSPYLAAFKRLPVRVTADPAAPRGGRNSSSSATSRRA